jgi:hypothetical protein
MFPPGTGWTIALHTFGPKKGAVTCVSWRLRMGAAKDWRLVDGVDGRYTIFGGCQYRDAGVVTVEVNLRDIPVDS